MAITDKNTIYSWFQTDDFPTEAQFRATWDSFWHKSESIPMSQITGLNQLFQQTATVAQLNAKANVDGSNIDVSAYQEKLNITNLIATAKEEVKNELLNGAPEAFDTLKEISDWISDDETAEAAILQAIQNEATARTEADNQKLDKGTYTGTASTLKSLIDTKADLVGGVVPASQLPFSVNTSEVIAVGEISATENTVTLSVHSSGTNAVRINGVVLTRAFPNTFNFTPVTDGSKFLIIYAINESGIFRLAEGVEDLGAVEPELPAGALFVRRILINSAGAEVELPTLTGFKEKKEDNWKVFLFSQTDVPVFLPFSDGRTSFLLLSQNSLAGNLILGGFARGQADANWWNGKELTILNNTGTNVSLQNIAGFDELTQATFRANYVIKNNEAVKVKVLQDGDLLEVIAVSIDKTTENVVATTNVGAINAGETIPAGTTIQELTELLLNKTFYPTFVNPTFGLTNNAGLREVGSSFSVTLTFNFNRGQILGKLDNGIWNPTMLQDYRAGVATSYLLNGVSGSNNSASFTVTTLLGTNTLTGSVIYAEGAQPKDSKNNDFESPFPAGTSPIQSTSFEGIYPYFYYKSKSKITPADMQSAIANGQATKVLASSTGTITIPFAANGEYIAVAYPATSTTKTIWYVNALDNGEIPGGLLGGVNILPCNSPNRLWNNVNFKIHVSAGLITQDNPIQLRN